MTKKTCARRPRGRPSSYRRAVADDICCRLANGESLRKVCATPGMPDVKTVLRWAADNINNFRHHYARAMEARAHLLVEEIIEIADIARPDDVQVRRLQVDSRKWVAGKLWPRVFGEPVQSNAQQLGSYGNPADSTERYDTDACSQGIDKLSEDELLTLVALCRKMGARLPHEKDGPIIEVDRAYE